MRVTTPLSHVRQKHLLTKLQNRGVQGIHQGSRLQLPLPINRFFVGQNTTIKEEQATILRLIALYLHNYMFAPT